MKDQLSFLHSKGISAAAIESIKTDKPLGKSNDAEIVLATEKLNPDDLRRAFEE